jgi:hypothetical protein
MTSAITIFELPGSASVVQSSPQIDIWTIKALPDRLRLQRSRPVQSRKGIELFG